MEHLLFKYAMDKVDPNFVPYYFQQFLVLRPDKSTTKIPVVFHASFKSRTGKSLNNILMVGSTIQLDSFDIILRFRRHKVAVAADIDKMYYQVLIDSRDRHLQKIIYCESLNSEPKVGILNTLTYSTLPASFIATKYLFILSNSIAESHPKCTDGIRKDFYMNDLLTGCDTIDEVIELSRVMIQSTLLSAKFPLQKYISNSSAVLKSLGPSLVEAEPSNCSKHL